MAHQSLYRRYRPRRFEEVRGQDHVVRALRNAVATGTEGHAYLFSGPRGTGKTSTARILAKALNCEDLRDGEPCCECSSCVDMEAGRSFDLFELDAASNNKVEHVRELIERAAVGSPGRTKVYILDEVHMLSPAASNALLKTLEEPPGHVCFVLATTDPQKVLPTIRSRTQHYEFQLLSADELTDYVRWIAQDAPLAIDEEAVRHVVREGRGSARDTLSALDQVVAAGGVITRAIPLEQILRAIADRDSGAAVSAVSEALAFGHDPVVLTGALLAELRDAFLMSLGVEVAKVADVEVERRRGWAEMLGTPTLTRAVELCGTALVDMRRAADPRVPLEVALVRLCTSGSGNASTDGGGTDGVVADLLRRIEALERAAADGRPAAARPSPAPVPAPASTPATASGGEERDTPPSTGDGSQERGTSVSGPAAARAALGAVRAAGGRTASSAAGATPADETSRPTRPPAPPARPTRRAAADAVAAPAASSDRTDAPDGGSPTGPGPSEPTSASLEPEATAPTPPAATSVPSAPTSAPPAPTAATSVPSAPTSAPPAPTTPARPAASDVSAPASSGGPDRDALVLAFGDRVLPALKGVAKAVYGAGRFVSVTDRGAVFELENGPTRDRAERFRSEVEAALGAHFGTSITLVLTDATDPSAAPSSDPEPPVVAATEDDESAIIDVHELEDADVATTGVEKLTRAFPGATLVEEADPA